jgi:DNA-binding transcriptional LysR family regulator
MVMCDEFADGRLIRLLPEWEPKHGVIHAVLPSRRALAPSVRALIDYQVMRFERLRED